MPVKHEIDEKIKIIITTWSGEVTDEEMIEAMARYKIEFRNQPQYQFYNEIADMRNMQGTKLTTKGIRKLSEVSAKFDQKGDKSKMAYVANSSFIFGLTRMYETFRGIKRDSQKETKIFEILEDAIKWICEQ